MLNPVVSFRFLTVCTLTLACEDLILLADRLISNLLTWIGDLEFMKIQISMQSGQAKFDPGQPILSVTCPNMKFNS